MKKKLIICIFSICLVFVFGILVKNACINDDENVKGIQEQLPRLQGVYKQTPIETDGLTVSIQPFDNDSFVYINWAAEGISERDDTMEVISKDEVHFSSEHFQDYTVKLSNDEKVILTDGNTEYELTQTSQMPFKFE